LKFTVFDAGFAAKLVPESVIIAPATALGGEIDASASGGGAPVVNPEVAKFTGSPVGVCTPLTTTVYEVLNASGCDGVMDTRRLLSVNPYVSGTLVASAVACTTARSESPRLD
jgi:hypothetical protein